MQIKNGSPTWSKLQKADVATTNAGIVTVLVGETEIVKLPSVTLAAGDICFVTWFINGTKGGVAGDVALRVKQDAGTGQIVFGDTQTTGEYFVESLAAAGDVVHTVSYVGKCSVGGTYTMELVGFSGGSNLTVNAGNAQIRLNVIRGS